MCIRDRLLLAQKSRKYTTPKLWDGYWRITSVLLPYEFTLLQNDVAWKLCRQAVLLPYEFTLLQNLKKRHLELLPVYVSLQSLDEVVVVGMGTQRKASVIGSIASVRMADLKVPSRSLENALVSAIGTNGYPTFIGYR